MRCDRAEAAAKWRRRFPARSSGTSTVSLGQRGAGTLAARRADVGGEHGRGAEQVRQELGGGEPSGVQQQTTTRVPRSRRGAGGPPKMEAALAKLFPAIASAVSSLPPRGDIEANIAAARSLRGR